MSRQSMTSDIAAQICWQYLHGGFDETTNEKIYDIAYSVVKNKHLLITFVFEIAYRIGYAKSALMNEMSEVTYKLKKQRIRDELVATLGGERSENGY